MTILATYEWVVSGLTWAVVRVPTHSTPDLLDELGVFLLGPAVPADREREFMMALAALLPDRCAWMQPGARRFAGVYDVALGITG